MKDKKELTEDQLWQVAGGGWQQLASDEDEETLTYRQVCPKGLKQADSSLCSGCLRLQTTEDGNTVTHFCPVICTNWTEMIIPDTGE